MKVSGDVKLGPTWGGPYIIVLFNGDGSYRLKKHMGHPVHNPHNATYLKKCVKSNLCMCKSVYIKPISCVLSHIQKLYTQIHNKRITTSYPNVRHIFRL